MTAEDNAKRISALYKHDKHERWLGLSEIEMHLDTVDFWKTLISVWTSCEANGRQMPLITDLIDRRLTNPPESSWLGMSEKGRDLVASYSDEIIVYRGCSLETPFTSWSFTTDRKTALWFAEHRIPEGVPCLVTAKIRKADILFADSHESEVVINPNLLISPETTELPDIGPEERKRSAFFMAVQNGLFADEDSLLEMDLLRISAFNGTPEAYVDKNLEEASELENLGFTSKPEAIRSRMKALLAILEDDSLPERRQSFSGG